MTGLRERTQPEKAGGRGWHGGGGRGAVFTFQRRPLGGHLTPQPLVSLGDSCGQYAGGGVTHRPLSCDAVAKISSGIIE